MPLYAALDGERVYQRNVPGGGYIATDATQVSPLFAAPKIRGQVVVERRLATLHIYPLVRRHR